MPQTEAVLERILRLTDRVIETRDQAAQNRLDIAVLKSDVAALKKESKHNSESSMISIVTTFLKEVMPPKTWALGLFLLLASVLGIASPKEIIAQFIEVPGHKK